MDKDITGEFCLSQDNLDFINKGYKAISRSPSLWELEMCRRILEERRGKTEGYYFSAVDTDATCVRETFVDLKEKACALFGNEFFPASFGDLASVLEDYMRMIGRGDESLTVASQGDSSLLDVTDSDGKAVFTFKKGKVTKRAKKKESLSYENMAILYLDASQGDADLGGIPALFEDEGFKNLTHISVKIGEYGILGAICGCDFLSGIKADISRLPWGEDKSFDTVGAFRGEYILIVNKNSIPPLKFLGAKYGVQPIYFAYPTMSGLIEGNSNAPFTFPIDTIRKLISSGKEISPTVAVKKYFSKAGRSEAFEIGGRLTVSDEIDGADGFLSAVDRICSLILTLVCRGVDRRAVCLAFDYRLAEETDAPEVKVGEALALCLGAYRVGMEIATPVGVTQTAYSSRENTLFCSAYAVKPRYTVSGASRCLEKGIYFMPVAKGADGLIDFSDFRRVCDGFTQLYGSGKIFYATAVTGGGLKDALEEIEGEISLNESGEALLDTESSGILFVCEKNGKKNISDGICLGCIGEKKNFS